MSVMHRANQLRRAARELWDNKWTLRTHTFADGSQDLRIFHSRGRVTVDGVSVLERDRLTFDDEGNIIHDRVRIQPERQVESEIIEQGVTI